MKKKFGKRGIFLTAIAITIIATFIIMFIPSSINLRKDIPVIKTRVETVNEFVVDLESVYLERALQSSGIKAINSLILYMESQNQFLTDFEAYFTEVLLNGTVEGTPIDDIIVPDIMKNGSYLNWTGRIENISESTLNVDTNIIVNDIKTYQVKPWVLNVEANISFHVISETASWDKNISVITEISIEKFDDPYYLINTGGAYRNRINRTKVKVDEWNNTNVRDHIRYRTYTHFDDSKAPNFIMRFTNTSLNSSCCGIESIVNPNELSNLGLNDDVNESYADYLFFNHTYQDRCDELYEIIEPVIESQFENVKFEFNHLVLYNLTDPGEAELITCP